MRLNVSLEMLAERSSTTIPFEARGRKRSGWVVGRDARSAVRRTSATSATPSTRRIRRVRRQAGRSSRASATGMLALTPRPPRDRRPSSSRRAGARASTRRGRRRRARPPPGPTACAQLARAARAPGGGREVGGVRAARTSASARASGSTAGAAARARRGRTTGTSSSEREHDQQRRGGEQHAAHGVRREPVARRGGCERDAGRSSTGWATWRAVTRGTIVTAGKCAAADELPTRTVDGRQPDRARAGPRCALRLEALQVEPPRRLGDASRSPCGSTSSARPRTARTPRRPSPDHRRGP